MRGHTDLIFLGSYAIHALSYINNFMQGRSLPGISQKQIPMFEVYIQDKAPVQYKLPPPV
jgi:hypothetical protein